jgi:predicted SnoaL-like aldol condensation-catalyzing enzyme
MKTSFSGGLMSEHQENMVVRWFEEVWNQGRRQTIDEMMGPDFVLHDGPSTTKGPEAFKLFFDRLRADFSGIRVTCHETVSAGDISCLRWSATMRHKTGKDIRVTGMSMLRFADGRFAEAWQNWDMHGMMEQLGESPPRGMYIASPDIGKAGAA